LNAWDSLGCLRHQKVWNIISGKYTYLNIMHLKSYVLFKDFFNNLFFNQICHNLLNEIVFWIFQSLSVCLDEFLILLIFWQALFSTDFFACPHLSRDSWHLDHKAIEGMATVERNPRHWKTLVISYWGNISF